MTHCLIQGEESMLMDETDAQSPEHEKVQVMHAEWVENLLDVKNELMQVREFVVRRERSAETKAEIAARRLDRMEQEQHEVADAEHEANKQDPYEPVKGSKGGGRQVVRRQGQWLWESPNGRNRVHPRRARCSSTHDRHWCG